MGPDDVIDHEAPLTPYKQLAEILKARIQRGDFRPGRAIPSENQLVQQYGIARSTVRRTVAALVEDGWVFTVAARGSFVSDPLPEPGKS